MRYGREYTQTKFSSTMCTYMYMYIVYVHVHVYERIMHVGEQSRLVCES